MKKQREAWQKTKLLSSDFINLFKLETVLNREWPNSTNTENYIGIKVKEDSNYVVDSGKTDERKSQFKIYDVEKIGKL